MTNSTNCAKKPINDSTLPYSSLLLLQSLLMSSPLTAIYLSSSIGQLTLLNGTADDFSASLNLLNEEFLTFVIQFSLSLFHFFPISPNICFGFFDELWITSK
jgi:hypothetical protein